MLIIRILSLENIFKIQIIEIEIRDEKVLSGRIIFK